MHKFWVVALALAILSGQVAAQQQVSPDEQLAGASALYDAKRYAEAAVKLDAFVATNPTHAKVGVAALVLGKCYSELKQYSKAVPAYEKAVASGDATVLTPARLGLGEAALYGDQLAKAPPALEAALRTGLKPDEAALAWYWLGQVYSGLKLYDQAGTAYQHVVTEFPNADFADSAAFGYAVSAYRAGNMDAARRRMLDLVSHYPKTEYKTQAVLLSANIDLAAKRFTEARTGYEQVLGMNPAPGPDEAHSAEDGLIHSLLELGDYTAVVPRLQAFLNRVAPTDAQRLPAELSLGHSEYHLKQFQAALDAYKVAAASPDQAIAEQALYWAGNAASSLMHPAEAADFYAQLVLKYPHGPYAAKSQLNAADAYAAAGATDKALTAYKAVMDNYAGTPQAADARTGLLNLTDGINDPTGLAAAVALLPAADRGASLLRLGRMYLDAMKYSEAASALTAVINSGPASALGAQANYLLAITDESQMQPIPAIAAYKQALKLDSSASWAGTAEIRLAWLYLDQKQPAESEANAQAALASNLDAAAQHQVRLALVQAQLAQQQWVQAIATSQALLGDSRPTEIPSVIYTLAWVSDKLGKTADGMSYWEKLVTSYPASQYSDEAFLKTGDARLAAGKFEEARDRYARLLAQFPKSELVTEAHYKLGSSYFNLSKFAEAAGEYDQVAGDKSAGDVAPDALYWSAVAFDKLGKSPEAIDRLSKLVENYPAASRIQSARLKLAALKALAGQ